MRQLLPLGFALLFAPAAAGQTFTTARVAQSGDTPAGFAAPFANNFTSSFPSAHSDGTVAFTATADGNRHVFTGTGGGPLTVVAGFGAAVPGTAGGTFTAFGTAAGIGAGGTAFQGEGGAVQGLYLAAAGGTQRIADTTTIAPGQGVPFTAFAGAQTVAVSGQNLAYRGEFGAASGLFARYNGTESAVADTATPMPGGNGNFTSLGSNQVLSGSVTVFRGGGSNGQQGVYIRDLSNASNPLIRVTDKTLPLPGTAGLITTLSEPAIGGSAVTVIASSGAATQRVVRYAWNGSNTAPAFAETVVAKVGDPVPGTAATISSITVFSPSDGDRTAFLAGYNDGTAKTGVFFHDGTALYKLADTGTAIDGKTVSNFFLGQDAVAGDYVAFRAAFAGGTTGVYVVKFTPVPEPLSVLAATAAFGGLAALRRFTR